MEPVLSSVIGVVDSVPGCSYAIGSWIYTYSFTTWFDSKQTQGQDGYIFLNVLLI